MFRHLRQIAVFSKTAELGSFRAAAKELRLSASVVSHHISRLEEHLGTPLLFRSTRKMSLTYHGEQFLVYAKSMVDAAQEGMRVVSENAPQPSGRLRITVPNVLSHSPITKKIAAFALAYPNVLLDLDYSDLRRDIIGEGIDIALSMGFLQDSSLKARKFYEVERHLFAARSYLHSKPTPKHPLDIEDWDWLELTPVALKPVFRKAGESVALQPSSRLKANDARALYYLMRNGVGLALLPSFLAQNSFDQEIAQIVLPDWRERSVSVYAVWAPNNVKNNLTHLFVNFLADESDQPGQE